ncbi:MAG: hypothetical protein R6V02_08815, partial [Candidatus Aminicenantes bacterium]
VGKISDKPSPSSDLIFFGALSPLHGIDVVLKAFGLLKGRDRSLTIVGDGQSGHRVAEYMAAHSDACIRWIREWQSLESLSEIIAGSKIALGVFGGCGKASTVLPLKAYISLCLGKPFVTQKQFSVPGEAPAPPFVFSSFVVCYTHDKFIEKGFMPPAPHQRQPLFFPRPG